MAVLKLFQTLGVLIMATLCLPASAVMLSEQSINPLALDTPGEKSIGLHSFYLSNPGEAWSLVQAFNSPDWQQSNTNNPNFGFSQNSYWLATRLTTTTDLSQWYFRIHYTLLDRVTAYLCPLGKPVSPVNCSQAIAGDAYPFSERVVQHPELIAPLGTLANSEYWLLFHFQTQGSYQLAVGLVDQQSLSNDLVSDSILIGGYLSMMLIMGLYNLFLYFSTRDRSHFYYSLFVLSFLLFHMTYTSSAFQYFWPEHPEINSFILPWIFSLKLMTIALFIPQFLNLKQHSQKAFLTFRVYLAIAVTCFFLNSVISYQKMVAIQNLLSMTFTITGLIVGLRFWISGVSSARFFTIAWLSFIIGLSIANARTLGLLPTNFITLYGYQVGSFIEIILLSLALGERITQLQHDRLESRKAMMQSQSEAIRHLRNYEDLYENSLTGQFQLDDQGFVIKNNPAWNKITGNISKDDGSQQQFSQLFKHDKEYQQLNTALGKEGHIQAHICTFKATSDNQEVIVSLSIRRGLDSESASWIGTAQDVSDKYQKEARLKQLQEEKTQSLRQLVMGVAHEMNTPLGNIRLAESFLSEQKEHFRETDREICNESLQHIDRSVDRLKDLTQLMKDSVVVDQDYGRAQINLREWLEIWSKAIRSSYPQLTLNCEVHSFTIEWDTYPEALQQILQQLITNSINHNAELAGQQSLAVCITISDTAQELTIRYRDSGKGINPEQQQSIFLPFYTTLRQQASNKGLGLYQTYNLITELMNGYIYWPEEAEGFDMTIIFPLSPNAE